MNKPKFTPGPWEVLGPHPSINVGPCVDFGSSGGFGDYPEPPMYEPVCTVFTSPDYKTEANDETMANARLIAVSPEMYQVCDELIKSIRERYQVPPDQELDCEHLRKLESLLKKAKGES